ncbi:MAG TPA: efflux RND transporter periplasmic adaptor subunit, partial [Anaerolineae bacterium]|nr:efflux RND transporter periplasmic adaptor subunit [Anaerolineae bacterium]
QVRQAELSMRQAQIALERTQLRAPFDGVVAAVNITPGELVGSGIAPPITLVDLSRFHIDVSVDEVDIGQVREGQRVEISLDALPDAHITGHISRIEPAAKMESGVISYGVTIVIDPTDAPLRAGMSATASIITAEVDDALIVPNRAIFLNRQTGEALVEKLVDGVPVRTDVQIGLRNETQSQVVSGLEEGDVIAIRSVSSRNELRRAFGLGG